MTLEEMLTQLPNFIGMGIAILVLLRQISALQEANANLVNIIVTKQNCANVEGSPPSDKQALPVK